MKNNKRFIEESFPVKEVSAESYHHETSQSLGDLRVISISGSCVLLIL